MIAFLAPFALGIAIAIIEKKVSKYLAAKELREYRINQIKIANYYRA